MKPGRVIGRVISSVKTDSLTGVKFLVIACTDWLGNFTGETIIAVDTVGAGASEFVFYVEARDAAIAVTKEPPVDAAIIGIIDGVEIEEPCSLHE